MMSDTVTEIRQAILDVLTPELKSHAAKLDSLHDLMMKNHDEMMRAIDEFRAEMRSEFASLRAKNQADDFSQLSSPSKRRGSYPN